MATRIDYMDYIDWVVDWEYDEKEENMSEWTCVDEKLPDAFGDYDVTIEDCGSNTRVMNVAMYRVMSNTWELLIDRDRYEGFRVIAWRDRGQPFEWKDLNGA